MSQPPQFNVVTITASPRLKWLGCAGLLFGWKTLLGM
jgi:hypothetical protein